MIYSDQRLGLIQQIRAIHAMAETGLSMYVLQQEAYKLRPLQKYFNMHFETGPSTGVHVSQLLTIDHSKPSTSIGEIERTLIFPHAITRHLRLMWQENRKFKYSFAGLVNSKRKSVIENWLKKATKGPGYKLPDHDSVINRLIRKLFSVLKVQRTGVEQYGDFHIWASTRGRVFPGKTWDEDYYKFLANSEFVLCPSGVHVWSYRFFESILCGAIPVIEEYCDAYKGFRFKCMNDDIDELISNKRDAEYNYNLCLERITIPKEELTSELTKFSTAS